jgi:hypothetical protein
MGRNGLVFALREARVAHVSVGSISEVGPRKRHVRFPPVSDQTADIAGGPFRANSLNSAHIHGTRVPVEEPSRASKPDRQLVRPLEDSFKNYVLHKRPCEFQFAFGERSNSALLGGVTG